MSKNRALVYGNPIPQDFLDSLQEFISTSANNLVISSASATSIRIVAGTGNGLVSIGISGLWRYNTATVSAAHPGGSAGQWDVFVVASANSFTPGSGNETDNTDYSFGLVIVAHGATPSGNWNGRAIVASRKIGEVTWSGSAITAIQNLLIQPPDSLIASGTRATRPAAGALVGFYYATDQDSLWLSNGSVWKRMGAQPGDLFMTMNATAAAGRVLLQGQLVARDGIYADLFTQWGTTYGVGDGSTTFALPDMRGRTPVVVGTHADVTTPGQNDGVAVGSRRPKHDHTVTDPGHNHNYFVTEGAGSHSAGGGGATAQPPTTPVTAPATTGVTVGPQTGFEPVDSPAYGVVNMEAKL